MCLSGTLENHGGTNTVLMDCVDRIIYGRLETGLCCQVEDMIDVLKDRSDGIIVSDVFNTNLDVSVPVEPVIVGTLIIDSNDLMTLTQQVITKIGTDESTSTQLRYFLSYSYKVSQDLVLQFCG